MRSASCDEIARPRPVPPYWRVVDTSACEKLSKIDDSFSSWMPTPVSRTVNRSATSALSSTSSLVLTSISPTSVNLMALPTRLTHDDGKRVALHEGAEVNAVRAAAAEGRCPATPVWHAAYPRLLAMLKEPRRFLHL